MKELMPNNLLIKRGAQTRADALERNTRQKLVKKAFCDH